MCLAVGGPLGPLLHRYCGIVAFSVTWEGREGWLGPLCWSQRLDRSDAPRACKGLIPQELGDTVVQFSRWAKSIMSILSRGHVAVFRMKATGSGTYTFWCQELSHLLPELPACELSAKLLV